MNRVGFGGYELLEQIGAGGMAEVFRARVRGYEGFAKLVAIKRIRPRFAADRTFVDMFVDEAKIAGRLSHANIAKIFDLGRVDGQYYIAMEHVHGRDVKAIFGHCKKTVGPVPVAQACYIAMKMCEGLDYAHSHRDVRGERLELVHRDISPQNVLVSFDGEVKIIDFGVAKALGRASHTQTGMVKGKLTYMSPEQIRGLPVDNRSDIYACGIVLYEMLTGRRLFRTDSPRETIMKIRSGRIVPLRTYNQRVPAALETIVLKALSLHPDDRFQTAGDLQSALHRFAYLRGHMCSSSDIASWLRGQFPKQFATEQAHLDLYRAIEPTPPPHTLPVRPPVDSRPIDTTLPGWAAPGGTESNTSIPGSLTPA